MQQVNKLRDEKLRKMCVCVGGGEDIMLSMGEYPNWNRGTAKPHITAYAVSAVLDWNQNRSRTTQTAGTGTAGTARSQNHTNLWNRNLWNRMEPHGTAPRSSARTASTRSF